MSKELQTTDLHSRANVVLMEPTFFGRANQSIIVSDWGEMRCLGSLSGLVGTVSAFHGYCDEVSFQQNSPARHDAFVIVAGGQVDQTINGITKTLSVGEGAIIRRGSVHRTVPLVLGTRIIVVMVSEAIE